MQKLVYLETAGGTRQYIDTGYIFKANSRLISKFICYATNYTAWQGYFGSYGSYKWSFCTHAGGNTSWGMDLGSAWQTTSPPVYDVDSIIESNVATGTHKWKSATTEVTLQETPSTVPTISETFKLFTTGNSWAISQNEFGKYRFYYMEMYEGDTLVHRWIPVKDDNNVVCIYDTVDGVYKYNAGTVAFTAGPPVPYKSSGTAILSLASYTVGGNDRLHWTAETPTGTSVTFSTSVNNGTWKSVANGGLISDMPAKGSTCSLRIRAELSTTDSTQTPALAEVKIKSNADKKILVLTPNIPNISSAVGNVTVSYDGLGNLRGVGGPTAAFDGIFTPTGLTWKGHQNDEEHVEVSASANVVLTQITYLDGQAGAEHVEVSAAATVTLTNIHDL